MNHYFPVALSDALLSTERALWGEVTPDLRAVTVEAGDRIRIRCVYDRPIDEDLREIVSMVEGEVLADYVDEKMVEAVPETQLDGPIILTASETPLYHRREADPLIMPPTSAHPGGHPDFLRDDRTPWTPQQVRQVLGRLAIQAALLGEVTPDLRRVLVDPTDRVRVRLFYDHPIDAEIDATVARVDAAVEANLHLDTTVTTHAEYFPEGRPPGAAAEICAYQRKEGHW